jgi:hypothetical protein
LASAQQKLEAELGTLAQFKTDRFAFMTQGGDLIIVPGAGDLAPDRLAAIAGEAPAPPEPIAATPEPIVLTPAAGHLAITGNQPEITIGVQPSVAEDDEVPNETKDRPWYEELTVVRRIDDDPFFGFDEDIPFPVPARDRLPRAIEHKLQLLRLSHPTVSAAPPSPPSDKGDDITDQHIDTAERRPFVPPAYRDLPIIPLTDQQRALVNEPFWINGGIARPETQRTSVCAAMTYNTNWLRN